MANEQEAAEILRNERSKSFFDHALGGTVIISMISAIMFFFGWVYLSMYYGYYGLDVRSLDFPLYAFLNMAAIKILIYATVFTLLLILLSIAWVIAQRSDNQKGSKMLGPPTRLVAKFTGFVDYSNEIRASWWARFGKVLIAILFETMCLMVLTVRMIVSAEEDASLNYKVGNEPVQLTFKPAVNVPGPLKAENEAGALRLLAQTKDLVFVFVQADYDPAAGTRKVYSISRPYVQRRA